MYSSEAADQIVKMSLSGVEVLAKITGAGAKGIATYLYAALKDQKRTKGKSRLTGMLRSGKELKVFAIKQSDLQKFTAEAKRYGVLYCVLKSKTHTDGLCDVMARAEDASRINRIVERFMLAAVDEASIVSELTKEKEPANLGVQEKSEQDKLIDELMAKPQQKEKTEAVNPTVAKTEKSPPSEPLSTNKGKSKRGADPERERPSVRQKLKDIIADSQKETEKPNNKQPMQKSNQHKQPDNKKRKPKSKGQVK